jgi:hypothetical protein
MNGVRFENEGLSNGSLDQVRSASEQCGSLVICKLGQGHLLLKPQLWEKVRGQLAGVPTQRNHILLHTIGVELYDNSEVNLKQLCDYESHGNTRHSNPFET